MKKIVLLMITLCFLFALPASALDIYQNVRLNENFSLPDTVERGGVQEAVVWDRSHLSTKTPGTVHITGTLLSDGEDVNLYLIVRKLSDSVSVLDEQMDFEQKTVVLSAEISGENGYASVLIFPKENAPVSLTEGFASLQPLKVQAEKIVDGKVEFLVDLSVFSGGGYTYFIIAGDKTGQGEFEYINFDEFIEEVKGVSANEPQRGADLREIYNKYAVLLEMKLEEVYNQMTDAEKEQILAQLPAVIAGSESIGLSEVMTLTDEFIAVKMLSEANDKKTVIESEMPYSEVLGLTVSKESYYQKMSNISAFYSDFSAKDLSDKQKIQTNFYQTLAVVSLNEADRTNIEQRLLDFNDAALLSVLNITEELTKLGELTSGEKENIYAQMAAVNNFTTVTEIKTKLSELLNPQIIVTPNIPSGSGGGGGRGGSHGNYGGMAAVQQPQASVQPTPNADYQDISTAEWARPYINKLSYLGIIEGYDNKIRPNDPIKKEELAKLIVLVTELPAANKKAVFSDVPEEAWYYDYINRLYATGIVNGITDTQFGAGTEISREDMAVMIYRTMQYRNQASDNDNSVEQFSDDAAISDYAKEAVYKMRELDIISGVGENQFVPKGVCSRAMAFKVIAEAFCN